MRNGTYGTKQKVYGKSVLAGVYEQRSSDASYGVILDASKFCPDASEGTKRKWRRAADKKAEAERLRKLRETVR